MDIDIKGVIISNDDANIYDYFGMENASPKLIANKLKEAKGKAVNVNINSGGGDVFAGSEIYTMLKEYKGNVDIKVSGIAASAASVIAMAGDKVSISPTAQIMIHNVSSMAIGDYRDMEHEAEVIKNYNNSIANAYMLKTGKSREELLAMMDKETWLSAEQAKENKFVDEILFENKNNVKFAASITNLLPEKVINQTRELMAKTNKENMQMKLDLLKLKKS